jgi:hypothetical protein
VTVYRVAADGSVADKTELALENGSTLPRTRQAELAYAVVTVPAPAVLLAGGSYMAAMVEPRQSFATALWNLLSANWPAVAVMTAIAAALAAGAWWWARAFGLAPRERAAWAVFVLLLGIPGLVGFLLHRRWPARVTCPTCGERTACDHDACTRCDTTFPAPALNGTEIFA